MIIGLESPPVLIGMDIMRPLRVRIDVTHGTATPAQPDPQTIHLNAAQMQDPPPPAALCCCKPSTCPPRQRIWSVAKTHSPTRTSSSVQKKVYLHLCPECLHLLVDPKCGSRSTTTALNLFAYIPGKPWALWRSSSLLTLDHHQLLPVHIARLLSPRTCRPTSSSS